MFASAIGAQQKKNTAAVLDLVNSGGVDKNEIAILTNRLSNCLVNAGVFTILEREKMIAVLKEQDFIMTDNCNSSECAVQVGQLLGVERMITGNIGKFGQVWTLDARIIDVRTGEVLKTQSENYKGEKEGLLDKVEDLAYLLCGQKKLTEVKKEENTSTFTDSRDGKTYKTVKIGNQVWMAENLNYETSSGSWCYDGISSNGDKYGRLYDWETAKKVAPPGWHLPSKEEWEVLLMYLGGSGSAAYNQMIPGGISGFYALFGGWRDHNGNDNYMGAHALFWSSSGPKTSKAWSCGVTGNDQKTYLYEDFKHCDFSVRCIKD